ncbi:MAG: DUF402 domain-containing protein [Acidimicrobiia bacterium]
MEAFTVQFLKYPDRLHWRHDMVHLGEDEHGTWLGAPAGTIVQKGDEPPIAWQHPFVQLIPRTGWFAMIRNLAPTRYELYVDVTAGSRLSAGRAEMIDLDLDVVRRVDGSVELLDEDEFVEHRIALGYPAWMAIRARATAARLVSALEEHREPFGIAAEPWMRRLEGSCGNPAPVGRRLP